MGGPQPCGRLSARHGGINAVWLVIAAVCSYPIAYRQYSLFIAHRVPQLDPNRSTPAIRHNDGLDYVPTNRYVLFGHHFAAFAGAGRWWGRYFCPVDSRGRCGPGGDPIEVRLAGWVSRSAIRRDLSPLHSAQVIIARAQKTDCRPHRLHWVTAIASDPIALETSTAGFCARLAHPGELAEAGGGICHAAILILTGADDHAPLLGCRGAARPIA